MPNHIDAFELAVQRYEIASFMGSTSDLMDAAWALYEAHGYPLGRCAWGFALWWEAEQWTTVN